MAVTLVINGNELHKDDNDDSVVVLVGGSTAEVLNQLAPRRINQFTADIRATLHPARAWRDWLKLCLTCRAYAALAALSTMRSQLGGRGAMNVVLSNKRFNGIRQRAASQSRARLWCRS